MACAYMSIYFIRICTTHLVSQSILLVDDIRCMDHGQSYVEGYILIMHGVSFLLKDAESCGASL